MRILIMGLGVHGGGLGVARWLLRRGHQLTITDLATAERLERPLAALAEDERASGTSIRYVLGAHREEDFTTHDMLVVNPAVRPDSPWLALARRAGLRIETEMTLFFRHCPGPILGITGTKGKTTTTLLTGAMLRQQWPDTVVAGNLRVSALEALDGITADTPVVLELSSFQLVGLGAAQLSPAYAAITNLSPDHLNYHGSMEEYARAKQQICLHQPPPSVLVIEHELLHGPDAAVHGWQQVARVPRTLTTFSAHDNTADCRITAQGQVMLHQEHVLDVADIRLSGTHNRANVLAALALARSFGASVENIRRAVHAFTGVEHRLELVATLDGVQYINDTTATNPAAAQAALHSLDAPLVLLAGGADKHLEMGALARDIARRVRALVLLDGSATGRLHQAVQDHIAPGSREPQICGPYADFAAAIRAAQDLAAPGDVVLLSPGCASFGMFHNEFHRGDEFRRIVQHELSPRIAYPASSESEQL